MATYTHLPYAINSCTRCAKTILSTDPDGESYFENALVCNTCFKDLTYYSNPNAIKIDCERCNKRLETSDWACLQNGHIYCADCYSVLSATPKNEQQPDWLRLASDYAKLKMALAQIATTNLDTWTLIGWQDATITSSGGHLYQIKYIKPEALANLQTIAQRAIDETL